MMYHSDSFRRCAQSRNAWRRSSAWNWRGRSAGTAAHIYSVWYCDSFRHCSSAGDLAEDLAPEPARKLCEIWHTYIVSVWWCAIAADTVAAPAALGEDPAHLLRQSGRAESQSASAERQRLSLSLSQRATPKTWRDPAIRAGATVQPVKPVGSPGV